MAQRYLFPVIAAIVMTTWLPYIFGWWLTPPQMRYFWLIYNPDDQNVHLMWARQAFEGKFLFHDLFTTEPHLGLFTNLFSLLLGWFCRLTGISLHLGYQIFRTVIAAAFLLTAHWFSGFFLSSKTSRLVFLLLVGFSSGFGWLPVLLWWLRRKAPPFFFVDVSPELMMPEANSFLSITVAPLSALGVTLVMGSLGCLIASAKVEPAKALRFLLLSTLFGIIVVNVHTYAAIPMFLAVLLWQAFKSISVRKVNLRELATVSLFASFVVLSLGGQWVLFSRDYAFVQKAATPTLTPNPIILIGSYGLIALGAAWGLILAWKKGHLGKSEWMLLLAWLLAIVISIYLPVSFQRKMIEGLHAVLCLFAASALEDWMERKASQRIEGHEPSYQASLTSRLMTALIAITALSQVAFFALNGYWLANNNMIYDTRFNPPYSRRLMPPYYLPEQHLRLFEWLERHVQSDEAILCHPMLGNYLPVLTGRKVFIGHWAETLNFVEKLRVAIAIWSGFVPVKGARELFRRHRIRYALETDFESLAVGGPTQLDRYGKVVFQVGKNRIFRLSW